MTHQLAVLYNGEASESWYKDGAGPTCIFRQIRDRWPEPPMKKSEHNGEFVLVDPDAIRVFLEDKGFRRVDCSLGHALSFMSEVGLIHLEPSLLAGRAPTWEVACGMRCAMWGDRRDCGEPLEHFCRCFEG